MIDMLKGHKAVVLCLSYSNDGKHCVIIKITGMIPQFIVDIVYSNFTDFVQLDKKTY